MMKDVKVFDNRTTLDELPRDWCACGGPTQGLNEPLCTCRMRDLRAINGRWMTWGEDHGPTSGPVLKEIQKPTDT